VNQAVRRPWYTALNHQYVSVGIDVDYFKPFHSYSTVTHVARHFHPFENLAWRRTATDGSWCPSPVRLAVRAWASAKPMAFHNSSKPSALRTPDDIDLFPGLENVHTYRLAYRELGRVIGLHLA